MKQPYSIVLDSWEASDMDVSQLLAGGVAGMIVRLNDMNGGHHIDSKFADNMLKAKQFPTHGIYFVYNPWVSGAANFDWLVKNVPADYAGRMFYDIEVRYPGYSTDTYAKHVEAFLALGKSRWNQTIYTGAWFLSTLSRWPITGVDYWWAAYPDVFNTGKAISWLDFDNILAKLTYAYNGAACPGGLSKISLWQCSGGGIKLPGMNKPMDVNVFPGSLETLKVWMGSSSTTTTVPVPVVKTVQQMLEDLERRVSSLEATRALHDATKTGELL
jgi:GH25 family lysozyme M1 (1,4-beta-N-acetylmuramidase)